MTTPITTFSSLPPEIISLIGTFLDKQTLSQTLVVCRAWRQLFTPSLWRVIRMSNLLMKHRFRTPESLAALTRNKHHIRAIETRDPELLYFLAPGRFSTEQEQQRQFGRLQSLSFRPYYDDPQLTGSSTRPFSSTRNNGNVSALRNILLGSRTHLRSLTLGEGCFWTDDGEDVFQVLMTLFPTDKLEKLHLIFMSPSKPFDNKEFTRILVDVRAGIEHRISDQKSFAVLREVIFSGNFGHIDIPRLAFLGQCPSLERLRLELVDIWLMKLMPEILPTYCPSLTHLEWFGHGKNRTDDELISMLLRSSKTGWKVLKLPFMVYFGHLSFSVLMESAATLEELVVEHWGLVGESAFLDLLCSARNLRRVAGLPDGEDEYEAGKVFIYAYDAFVEHSEGKKDRTWALGPSMEYLHMEINNVPRPDVLCRLNGDPLHLDELCRLKGDPLHLVPDGDLVGTRRYDVQRWVYEQLGRMTGLQELVLGVLEMNPAYLEECGVVDSELDEMELEEQLGEYFVTFQYFCLEFSMASGLELLGGMKELRVLDVRSTAHRIGVEELEWMYVNWPKLKEVKGLYSCRGWTGDVEGNLKWKAAVDAWILLSIDHIPRQTLVQHNN